MAEPAFDLNNEDGNWDQGPASIKTSQIRNAKKEVLRTTNRANGVSSLDEARRRKKQSLNDDWEYVHRNKLPNNASTDQIFSASYQTKGLQPHLNSHSERKKKVPGVDGGLPSKIPTSIREGWDLLDTIDEDFLEEYGEMLLGKSKFQKLMLLLARIKATKILISTIRWYGYAWLFVQLPFAILSIILFVALGTFDALIKSVTAPETTFGAIISAPLRVLLKANELFVAGANTVLGAVGSEITVPTLVGFIEGFGGVLFLICIAVVWAIGIMSVFVVYLHFTLKFLHPLSGGKTALKLCTLLLVYIGYSLPFLNLFPWIIVWLIVVAIYPK